MEEGLANLELTTQIMLALDLRQFSSVPPEYRECFKTEKKEKEK